MTTLQRSGNVILWLQNNNLKVPLGNVLYKLFLGYFKNNHPATFWECNFMVAKS